MRILIISLLVIFTFNACSSKSGVVQNNSTNKTVAHEKEIEALSEDEFSEDEFDDEFSDEDEEVFDPLSGYNRVMTSFNDSFYENIFDPTVRAYRAVVAKPVRVGILNFFDNLMFPVRFVNNLLQFKIKNATEELGRFLFNSTFGLLGIIDVADRHTSWKEHDEDFGQTLGFYGVGSGFHVVLPFLGPSNLRDMFGLAGDSFLNPTSSTTSNTTGGDWKVADNLEKSMGLSILNYVDKTSFRIDEYQKFKKDSIDLYPFLRDIYEQKRDYEIKE